MYRDREQAIAALAALEGRLARAPHEVLLVKRAATEIEILSAFDDLSSRYRPDLFLPFGAVLETRATRAYFGLCEALKTVLGQSSSLATGKR